MSGWTNPVLKSLTCLLYTSRPSGTEPKVKLYVMACGADAEACAAVCRALEQAGKELLGEV